jgi:SRSO17 transposase
LGRPPGDNLAPRDVGSLADQLSAYHAAFAPLFPRTEQRRWAKHYLAGQLLDLERKSIEPIARALEEGNIQVGLARFRGSIPFQPQPVLRTNMIPHSARREKRGDQHPQVVRDERFHIHER